MAKIHEIWAGKQKTTETTSVKVHSYPDTHGIEVPFLNDSGAQSIILELTPTEALTLAIKLVNSVSNRISAQEKQQ